MERKSIYLTCLAWGLWDIESIEPVAVGALAALSTMAAVASAARVVAMTEKKTAADESVNLDRINTRMRDVYIEGNGYGNMYFIAGI